MRFTLLVVLTLIAASSATFLDLESKTPFLTKEKHYEETKDATYETYSFEEHPFKNHTLEEVKGMMGVNSFVPYATELTEGDLSALPENFDARDKWANCVHPIRNQGKCGSCWAFAASEVLSDRTCIASQGKTDVVLSPEDLITCDYLDHGCHGGNPVFSWLFLRFFGIVTDQCKPYTSGEGSVESCGLFSWKCRAAGVPYKKYRSSCLPRILAGNIERMKTELVNNGPIETGFMVYSDFLHYKGGIYTHQSGSILGGHAVKIVGYGVENGVNYWTVANSWGPEWGENGFFKIKQGECMFEYMAVAGCGSQS